MSSFLIVKLVVLEQKADTPYRRNTYEGIDNPRHYCVLPAENPRNKVKLEKPDKSPVDTSDYIKYQRYAVNNSHKNHSFFIVCEKGVIFIHCFYVILRKLFRK